MNIRYNQGVLLAMITAVTLASCKKDPIANPSTPDAPARHALLKDIIIPNLPSPYYHFEYNTDSMITKVDFASGFTMYDVIYDGNKIREMRDNIIVNHDTLRYIYDTGDKVTAINFIDESNVIYRHAYFTYEGNQVKEIRWNLKVDNGDFFDDRILTFTYYPDSNVKSIQEQRRSSLTEAWHTTLQAFEQYDNGINVDDFSLIEDGFHDHLFLLQGFRLQKNNPGKESLSVDGVDFYKVDYTYAYNSDHTPSTKTGNLIYLSGSNAGQRFTTNSTYTYY